MACITSPFGFFVVEQISLYCDPASFREHLLLHLLCSAAFQKEHSSCLHRSCFSSTSAAMTKKSIAHHLFSIKLFCDSYGQRLSCVLRGNLWCVQPIASAMTVLSSLRLKFHPLENGAETLPRRGKRVESLRSKIASPPMRTALNGATRPCLRGQWSRFLEHLDSRHFLRWPTRVRSLDLDSKVKT